MYNIYLYMHVFIFIFIYIYVYIYIYIYNYREKCLKRLKYTENEYGYKNTIPKC
jgi:hypothetical protein